MVSLLRIGNENVPATNPGQWQRLRHLSYMYLHVTAADIFTFLQFRQLSVSNLNFLL